MTRSRVPLRNAKHSWTVSLLYAAATLLLFLPLFLSSFLRVPRLLHRATLAIFRSIASHPSTAVSYHFCPTSPSSNHPSAVRSFLPSVLSRRSVTVVERCPTPRAVLLIWQLCFCGPQARVRHGALSAARTASDWPSLALPHWRCPLLNRRPTRSSSGRQRRRTRPDKGPTSGLSRPPLLLPRGLVAAVRPLPSLPPSTVRRWCATCFCA